MGPYIKDKNSSRRMIIFTFIALIPIILFTVYKNGYLPYTLNHSLITLLYPLIFILTGAISSFIFEMLYALIFLRKKHNIKVYLTNSYGFMIGLLMALVLSINTPLPVLILGTFVATIIGKMIFGGFGKNIFNPALIGVLFIVICFGSTNYLNRYEVDTVSSSTPLTNYSILAATNGEINQSTLISPYGSLLDFFIGLKPGSVGETSALLCLIALLFLIITKTIKWRIPLFYIGTVLAMTFIISLVGGYSLIFPLFSILSGGLLFGATFMATDPVTSPITAKGQIIYGLCLGILTVIIRFLLPYPEGVMISILTMNLFIIIIDRFSVYTNKNIKWYILSIIIFILLLSGLSYYIGSNLHKEETKDSNYNIIEKVQIDNAIKYNVTQKYNYGMITANITFTDDKITKIDIISPIDSYYDQIIDAKYIDSIIKNQTDLSSVDSISSATYTSNAIVTMVNNTITDYNKEVE